MRDLLIVAIVVACCVLALRRPWIGVTCWTWLSLMNPHRYAYGFSQSAPVAAMAGGATLFGLLLTRQRRNPFLGAPVVWLALFCLWITLSWLFGLAVASDYGQWNKVMKINLMIFVAIALVQSREQIMAYAWVAILSLALLGLKGGVFTITSGGGARVWGPPGSFIADNNEFALAMVMTVPLLRFLQLQVQPGWPRHVLSFCMLMCVASALGSQSRGGFLAILAMAFFLWWKGKQKVLLGIAFVMLAMAVLAFMPDSYWDRINTIQTYEEDRSAMGRISAWWTAWRIALDHPLGVGFNPARADLFARYSPHPDFVHAAHSIYFQILGNHGFVGLFLFLGIWVSTWRLAGRLIKAAAGRSDARWCADLGAMVQVALVAYLVGGAFLSLAYFDQPYNLLMLVVCAHAWLSSPALQRLSPEQPKRWQLAWGLSAPSAKART